MVGLKKAIVNVKKTSVTLNVVMIFKLGPREMLRLFNILY